MGAPQTFKTHKTSIRMKRLILTLTILIACIAWNSTQAETKENRAETPHELRIGVGDCSIY